MEIRLLKDTDEEAVRALFARCFNKELSHQEWMWKYNSTPWGSTAAISLDGENIIAHYGGIKTRFHYKGRFFDVFQPSDVMTHPKYRARIFAKRGAMVKAGELFYAVNPMDFAFGFPSERHAVLGTKQLGYTEHNYVTALSKKTSGFKSPGNILLRVEKGWSSIDEKELDMLWQEVRNDCGLSIEKNSRYILWRYRDHPTKRYEPLIVRGRYRKRLKAFAVLSVNERELLVLDIFCVKTVNHGTLLNILENVAIKSGIKVIKLWINPAEDVFRSLSNHGYTAEKAIPYIFRVLNKEITPSFLFNNYFYRMGDYDAA